MSGICYNPGMNMDTFNMLTRDSVQEAIQRLEDRGFFLHRLGFVSKAPRTHHSKRQAILRAARALPHRVEARRALERRKQATMRGKWRHLRRSSGREGFMSFEQWVALWKEAGTITLGDGSEKSAWKMRGRGKGWTAETEVVQLRRWDLTKPFSLDNVYVTYKGRTLADGQEIAEREINDSWIFEETPIDKNPGV